MDALNGLKMEYNSAQCFAEENSIYAGFSERLNQLINRSNLNAPNLNEGRGTWLALIANASKPATSDWLLRDKPPKRDRLRALIIFLASYLPEKHKNIPMLESWVLYGDGDDWP